MAKKDKKKVKETTIEDFYDLKIDKVNELVAALKDDEVDEEQPVNFDMGVNMGVEDAENYTRFGRRRKFDPYKVDKLSRIPTWIKAIFIKWWFAGAISYFILWGLTIGGLDSVVLTGGVLGIVVDILVNPLFRYMESDRKEYNPYMMFPFPFKAFWTFFTNIIYYIIVVFLVSVIYTNINVFANSIAGTADSTYLGVEPLLFGVFCVVVDMAFIGLKDGVVALVRHIRNRKKENVLNV